MVDYMCLLNYGINPTVIGSLQASNNRGAYLVHMRTLQEGEPPITVGNVYGRLYVPLELWNESHGYWILAGLQ
jgi:hypothetical protein